MALMFFPRGGSSQVMRYVARGLPEEGWDVTLVTGSLGEEGEQSHAGTFFSGLDVQAARLHRRRRGRRPAGRTTRRSTPPTRTGEDAPDRVFAAVDDETYERLVAAWERELERGGRRRRRPAPPQPPDADERGRGALVPRRAGDRPPARDRAADAARDRGRARPTAGTTPTRGRERMRGWAQRCERLLVLSPDAVERVPDLLDVEPERVVWAPNGFEPESFDRRPITRRRSRRRSGGAGWWRSRAAGRAGGEPGTRLLRRGRPRGLRATARCCSTSGATPRSSASRC